MDLFEKLAQGRPAQEPSTAPIPQPISATARELLEWLQHTWKKPTIRTREIYRHGPAPVRWDKERALEAAEILTKRGWLLPVKARQRNVKRWQITIGPA